MLLLLNRLPGVRRMVLLVTGPVLVPERTIAGLTGFAIAVSVLLVALFP
jgi:hypothetical protein